MSEPTACGSCAFKPDCETFREPYNRLRSEVCALSAQPFYCHSNVDYKNIDPATLTREETIALRRHMPICQGWRRRVKQLAAKGFFANGVGEVRRILGRQALSLITRALKAEGKEKDKLFRDLDETIRMLAS